MSGNMTKEKVKRKMFEARLKEKGITHERLSAELDVTPRTIGRWVAGDSTPQLYPWQYEKLLSLLDWSPGVLSHAFLVEIAA